jgi:hypothetical protein
MILIMISVINCNNKNFNCTKHIHFHSIHISGTRSATNSFTLLGILI